MEGRTQGDAAEAITDAEAALAHQNSASAQLDLQVIAAILNAHQATVEGKETLDNLQRDVEAAVATRTDLDTSSGARDFQRFLIGKLREIRAVVANASLDDTSKSALMAAWASLYNVSKSEPGVPAGATSPVSPDVGMDPYLESLLAEDPGSLAGELPAQNPGLAPPMAPMMPSMLPGSIPGWSAPGGFPLPGLGPGTGQSPDEALPATEDPTSKDHPPSQEADQSRAAEGAPVSLPAGPTTVTLPDGETVTAASPQLAAVITAAAGGTPIAEAFHQQGITIPPPGTAVTDPVDPSVIAPGDIGIFTDRHALALGHSKALLSGQIQHISTVSGPSFLGWEHPPPVTPTAPATTATPTPTRPAQEEAGHG